MTTVTNTNGKEDEITIREETVNGKKIKLVSGVSHDGYDGEYRDFRVYVDGKFFDNTVSYDLRQNFVPQKALEVFREAKVSAWN